MRSYYALEPAQLGQLYLQQAGGPRHLPATATRLYEAVQAWLRRCGLEHRLNEAAEIATAAYTLAQEALAQAQPVPTPEQTRWQNDVMQGTTADDAAMRQADERVLAGQVAQMSQAEYAANRERFGLSTSTYTFLTGEPQ